MVLDLKQLPDDTQLLHQLVKELAGDLVGKQKIIADQQQEIQAKTHANQELERRLAVLNRYRFGKRSPMSIMLNSANADTRYIVWVCKPVKSYIGNRRPSM